MPLKPPVSEINRRPALERDRHYSRSALWLTWLLGAAMFATVVGVALHFTDVESFSRLLTQAQPQWLILAFVLQALTYVAQGQVFRVVLKAGGRTCPCGSRASSA